jgi:stearoyl-CoA desaturase (delta-9 desaturase)
VVRHGGVPLPACFESPPRSAFISTITEPDQDIDHPSATGQNSLAGTFVTWIKNVAFVFVHLACLGAFFTGVDTLALWLCAGCYLVRMFGITGGYHRYFAHRAYKTTRAFQFVLACLGCSALQKGPLWWAAHHRHHHRHADSEQDRHSPHQPNLWWSHVGWILSSDFLQTNKTAVRDWHRYPELRWLDEYHWVPGIGLAAGCFLIGGWSGLVWGFFISTVLLYHATFTVNSLCHRFGSQRYATGDFSRNNALVAAMTLGEGWHNNHHYYPSAANQGFFWWEIDISYYVLRLLGMVRLVWDLRKPPPNKIRPACPVQG